MAVYKAVAEQLFMLVTPNFHSLLGAMFDVGRFLGHKSPGLTFSRIQRDLCRSQNWFDLGGECISMGAADWGQFPAIPKWMRTAAAVPLVDLPAAVPAPPAMGQAALLP
jgi:hypothetical protein